jgi:hypothetical protein
VNTLVVARWNEDLQWTAQIPPGWALDVVQKDTHLPNRGREPSSFAWWIGAHYDEVKPDDLYGFVQGNPFPHCGDLFVRLTNPVDGFAHLGDGAYQSDGDGNPDHSGVPVADCHQRWLGAPFPGRVQFAAGGQFVVAGERLLARPAEFYRRMLDDLLAPDALSPWAAERLWPAIFAEEAP